ncbi:MAG: ribosomal-processing cysteine protease Prp [Blautia sp.]|nr:ribosomal-processing cysteine protease Prp [Blautia sp.]
MITIRVSKRSGEYVSFTAKGHAGYAVSGKDIICASVSALIINAVNSVEEFTDDKLLVKEADGFVSIAFPDNLSEKGKLLIDSLVFGLTTIQEDYNNRYLTVTVKEV